MPCKQEEKGLGCACDVLNRTIAQKKKCRYWVAKISKFYGKKPRIKIDPNTGKRMDE